MPKYKHILFAFIGFSLLSSTYAQEKKIYRWVDKDGKVQLSDQLPPDMVDKARKEYNASSGSLQKSIQTQLTPAEQAIAQQQVEIEAEALAQAAKAKRIEQGMLINYENEQELQHSFDERTELLQQTIISLKASIQSRRASVINALNELSDMELNGQALPDAKIKLIQNNHAAINKQTQQLNRLSISYDSLKSEFAQTMDKYRELKGIGPQSATVQADGTTPPAPLPPQQ